MSTAATQKKESRRPANTPFKQQRLKAWQPILTPKWVISTFFIVGIVFIPIGAVILDASNKIVETTIDYSDQCQKQAEQTCTNPKTKYDICQCEVEFTLEDDMEAPVYVYYQLENYYQNHRRYVKSRSDQQLRGDFGTVTDSKIDEPDKGLVDCEPDTSKFFTSNDKKYYWYPCGLIARSVFNDTFQLTGGPDNVDSGAPQNWTTGEFSYDKYKKVKPRHFWTDDKIAWDSDVQEKFKPKDDSWLDNHCRNTPLRPARDDWPGPPDRSDKGPYYCWQDVTDPDFIVWMRTAGLPTFKKLYRIINEDKVKDGVLKKGKYKLRINNIYDVQSFKGKKSVVFSTTSWIGGRNVFLGAAYIVVGSLCVLLGAVFLGKHIISPRQLGDQRYLVWKK